MIRLLVAILAIAPASAAAAETAFQDTVALDRAVATFTGHPLGDEGGARAPVDARLKLARCPMVAMSWHGAQHDAVVVTCSGPDWKVFVPVKSGGLADPAPAPLPVSSAAAPIVRAAPVIKRGDPVTVEAGSPGFSIAREGIAMGDAAPGGRLLVKVEDVKSAIQAVAIESGRATLPGWDAPAEQP